MGDGIKKLGVFAAVGAAVAGAAAFFLGTKKGQEMTREAMVKTEAMVNDITRRLKDAKVASEQMYHEIVDKGLKEWQEVKGATAEEVAAAKTKLVGVWSKMRNNDMHGHDEETKHENHDHKCEHC